MTSFLTEEEAFKRKHPHDEVIRAYLDGKPIQWKASRCGAWINIRPHTERNSFPSFGKENEYRIKPEVAIYRVALFKDSRGAFFRIAGNGADEMLLVKSQGFVRWATDWIEVEV